ncbi:MAG: hypothetical protein ABJE47_08005 [bacterium]
MTMRLLTLAALCAMTATPILAQGRTTNSVSIAGGIAAPTGNLGDATDLGYNVALGLNVGGPKVPIGLRFEGGYDGFGQKSGNGDVRLLNATANAVFNIGTQLNSPYLIGGLGFYNERVTAGNGSLRIESSRNAAGINVGGGLRFPLSGLSTFFEARYHLMFNDQNGGSNTQFIPITFGIMF